MLASLAMFALLTAHAASGQGRQNESVPTMSLLYQTMERPGGELRLCRYASEYERVLWRWRNPEARLLSRPFYSISPDGRRALVVQEEFLWSSGQGRYTFTLVDLDDADEAAMSLRLKAEFSFLFDYPMWLDNAQVLLGVTDEWKGHKGYRELVWNMNSGAVALSGRHTVEQRRQERASGISQVLQHLPRTLVPQDIRSWLQDPRSLPPLELTLDGASLSVPRGQLAIASYVSLAPSGQMLAVADMGRSLAVVTASGLKRQTVQALPVFTKEVTQIEDIHWSPDERWVLFTERHFQRRHPSRGVFGGPYAVEGLSLVRAINTESGEALTLVRGEDASWLRCP